MVLIYLKKEPRPAAAPRTSLGKFVREYLNQFCQELNDVLAHYRSIQEHAHRNRIIEFAEQKIKDIELFYMLVKGAYLQHNLALCTLKREDYCEQGARIAGMADFIAEMYSNMRMSFVPPPNVAMALQAAVYPENLLVQRWRAAETGGEQALHSPEKDFTEINRYIKIYLLRENISRPYEIVDGKLVLHSEDFRFELALCGDCQEPVWKLTSVVSTRGHDSVAEMLSKRLPSSICEVCAFIAFYESRKKARELFEMLRSSATGYYLNFTAAVDGQALHAAVQGSRFVCTIKAGSSEIVLHDRTPKEILGVARHAEAAPALSGLVVPLYVSNYRKELLGENYAFFVGPLYLAFSRKYSIFKMGQLHDSSAPIHFIHLQRGSGHAVGTTEKNVSVEPVTDSNQYIAQIQEFVKRNYTLFALAYRILEFSGPITIDQAIVAAEYEIKDGYRLLYQTSAAGALAPEAATEEFASSKIDAIVAKAMLIHIQRHTPGGFTVVDTKIGEKAVLEAHKIRILITSQLKTPIKALSEDCRRFSLVDGLDFIGRFGFFYKYNLFPSYFTKSRIVFNFAALTGEHPAVVHSAQGCRLSGKNTAKMLRIEGFFTEADYQTIGMLHRAYLINRFSSIKALVGADGSSKDAICCPNGARIVLTPEKLLFFTPGDVLDEGLTLVLNSERCFTSQLHAAGGYSAAAAAGRAEPVN